MIAAIALGSNLDSKWGDREASLREALRRLAALGTVTAVSTMHDTAPVGVIEQPRFLNAAALLETTLAPRELLRGLLQIEVAMGRVRGGGPAKGPRVIDLDVLLYGDVIVDDAELVVPHPALHERMFVLAPLAEIAAAMRIPGCGKTVAEMLAELV